MLEEATDAPALLNDEQMTRFLRDGFVTLAPAELDADFHAAMWRTASEVYDEARGVADPHLQVIGDNLRARIAGVDRLLNAPTVRGALASVLGEDYLLHPHHYVHQASTDDQGFHQDGNLPWNERAHYRSHRPNWAMLFYYPQDVTAASGPTEVLPGTQYWTTDFEKPDGAWHAGDPLDKRLRVAELNRAPVAVRDRRLQAVVDSLGVVDVPRRRLEVPAGTVVLAHYDLMHRGARAAADWIAAGGRRFLYKFYFLRTSDPRAPSWRNASARSTLGSQPLRDGIVETLWHWLRGDAGWTREVAQEQQAERILNAPAEDVRVHLAYEIGALARRDAAMRRALGRLMTSDVEAVRRAMAYAAGVAGAACGNQIAAAMRHEDARVRRVAAYAAGEARLTHASIIAALFGLLENDADDLVRSNAAYALGNIGRVAAVPARRLLARWDPRVEPDNTTSGGLSRSTVRTSIAYALCNTKLDDEDLPLLAERGLADHDRYAQGLAVAALTRHAQARGAPWMAALVDHLASRRFNRRAPKSPPSEVPVDDASPAV